MPRLARLHVPHRSFVLSRSSATTVNAKRRSRLGTSKRIRGGTPGFAAWYVARTSSIRIVVVVSRLYELLSRSLFSQILEIVLEYGSAARSLNYPLMRRSAKVGSAACDSALFLSFTPSFSLFSYSRRFSFSSLFLHRPPSSSRA